MQIRVTRGPRGGGEASRDPVPAQLSDCGQTPFNKVASRVPELTTENNKYSVIIILRVQLFDNRKYNIK